MSNKYYIPSIEEFHVGFEYEMKATFGDGTVKTNKQYSDAEWIKQTYTLREFPYVDRTMFGLNPHNHPCAIRVKYLDKEDVESLEFKLVEDDDDNLYFEKENTDYSYYDLFYQSSLQHLYISEHYQNSLIGKVLPREEWGENVLFNGTIKNFSELSVLLKQIGVE